MNTYEVLFSIGEKKLKMNVEASDEIDAWDKIKAKMTLVAVSRKESGNKSMDDFRKELQDDLAGAFPDMPKEEQDALINATLRIVKTDGIEAFRKAYQNELDK